jgi:hypothetical protein
VVSEYGRKELAAYGAALLFLLAHAVANLRFRRADLLRPKGWPLMMTDSPRLVRTVKREMVRGFRLAKVIYPS